MNEEFLARYAGPQYDPEQPEVRFRREYEELKDLERAEQRLEDARARVDQLVAARSAQ